MPTLVAEAGLMLFQVNELFLGKYIYKFEHKIERKYQLKIIFPLSVPHGVMFLMSLYQLMMYIKLNFK